MIPDFELRQQGDYAPFLSNLKIERFSDLADYLRNLPYGRTSKRDDFSSVFQEARGTCSSKHAILAELCDLNGRNDIELIVGIFLMDATYSGKLAPILERYQLEAIPEAHCYLRFQNQRYDFSASHSKPEQFQQKLVREQRCEPRQVIDWKRMIHQHYLTSWLKRKQLPYTPEQLFEIREACILALSRES